MKQNVVKKSSKITKSPAKPFSFILGFKSGITSYTINEDKKSVDENIT